MRIKINTGKRTPQMRILSAFMAFLIFTMTCPELFEGWGIGLIVHAAYDSHIQTGDTTAYMANGTSSAEDKFTYAGKMKTGDVTVFDYVSDKELINQTIDLGIGSGGYHDPYTAFNNAVSHTNATVTNNSSSNITFIYKTYRKGVTDTSIHIFDGSGHNNGWPGQAMEFDYERNAYVLTINFNTLKSALSNNASIGFIVNGHDSMSGSSKLFETESINTGTMVVGTSYTYSDLIETPGTANQVGFTLPKSIARAIKVGSSVGGKNYLEDGEWSGSNYPVKVNIWDDDGHYNSRNRPDMSYSSSSGNWTCTLSSSNITTNTSFSNYNSTFYVTFQSIKYHWFNDANNTNGYLRANDYGDASAQTDAFVVKKGYNYTFTTAYETGTADNTTCQYTNPLYLGMFYITREC